MPPRLKDLLEPAALVLAALLAFGVTLKTGFLWDDHQMIERNPRLELTAANLAAAFKGDPFGQGLNYYRPLQTVSNMLDFAVWGYRPFGFHLTNFLCHAAAAVLFFYLALALNFPRGPAFWAAALLAVHPAAVEQLLVVAGRAELAAAACALASLLLFVKGRDAGAFVFFLAACGFKETGLAVPPLAALCLWRLGRGRREYLRLLPLFAAVPFYLFARQQALGMGALARGAGPVLAGLALKAPAAVLAYLREALLPFDMHSHRLQPDLAALRWLAPGALLAAGAWLWRRGGQTALFCAGWYLLNLAPKLPLLAVNDLMLDHWVYLANAGLFLGAAAWLWERAPRLKPLLPAAAAACALLSASNALARDTDLEIYEHAVRRSSSKPMRYNLAREYFLLGRAAESRAVLEAVTAEEPGNALYLNGLALARAGAGDTGGALAALDAALALRPGDPETLFNRYSVLARAGKKETPAALLAVLAAAPGHPPALLAAARGEAAAGRAAGAARFYAALLAANPNDLEGLNDYGVLLARAGDLGGAERLWRRALSLAPGQESVRANLARLEAVRKTSGTSGGPAAP